MGRYFDDREGIPDSEFKYYEYNKLLEYLDQDEVEKLLEGDTEPGIEAIHILGSDKKYKCSLVLSQGRVRMTLPSTTVLEFSLWQSFRIKLKLRKFLKLRRSS